MAGFVQIELTNTGSRFFIEEEPEWIIFHATAVTQGDNPTWLSKSQVVNTW